MTIKMTFHQKQITWHYWDGIAPQCPLASHSLDSSPFRSPPPRWSHQPASTMPNDAPHFTSACRFVVLSNHSHRRAMSPPGDRNPNLRLCKTPFMACLQSPYLIVLYLWILSLSYIQIPNKNKTNRANWKQWTHCAMCRFCRWCLCSKLVITWASAESSAR